MPEGATLIWVILPSESFRCRRKAILALQKIFRFEPVLVPAKVSAVSLGNEIPGVDGRVVAGAVEHTARLGKSAGSE